MIKQFVVLLLVVGYILNIYYLTIDEKVREFNIFHKIGVIILPIGGVMGLVYYLDEYNVLRNIKEK